jgi:4-amino-4-deoxy-L-arabinose transferase-like glycosyltransferase
VIDRPSRWPALLWLALWLLATLGLRPLMLPDEGRYAGVAFEMLNGSRLVPLLDGLPFFHKPPLLYWLDAAAMGALGVHAFAARVGPALMAWLLGAALYLHVRRWHGQASAQTALGVLATSPLFFIGGQYVNHDMGVAACITVAVLCFVRAVDEPASVHRGWMLAGWAACALGVLAKGLIGLVLPALVVLPWLLAQRRWRAVLALLHPLGLSLFAAIALPWMLVMQSRYPGFFDYFIVEQHVRRYAGVAFNNREPLWFFWVVLPLLMLPWALWLWPALRQRGARAGLYLWWVVTVVGFFSLPASKLVGYVMPALAPMAALLALALATRPRPWPRVATVAAGAALLCVAAVVALAWQAPGSHRDLGIALRERWQPGDRLVFVDADYYDLRFYARVQSPAIVLSNWADPELQHLDNWRKELLDAARFAPEQGRALLWGWARLPQVVCHSGQVWLVAGPDKLPRLAALRAEVVFAGRHASLLRVAGQACADSATGLP